MSLSITLPAVTRPRRRTEILSRPRLLDLLYDQLERKLILVIAPAGYGKTSLLVDFAHQEDIQACWYTVDRYDQELQRFAAHFIAAISNQYPTFGKISSAALQAIENLNDNFEPVITTIVNDLYEQITSHFVIVLDDFHVVANNNAINRFIARFIERVDENCHLIISSRQELRIPDIELFVGQGKVGYITECDLVFTAAEVQSLTLKGDRPLSKDQAIALTERTEGWITGIILANFQIDTGASVYAQVTRNTNRSLDAYWTRLVGDQPEVIQKFLLYTSLFSQFNARLCQNVLGTTFILQATDWDDLLEKVFERNLFAQPVGERDGWVRYHGLFQEYLQERMEKEFPGSREIILRRMIAEYASEQEWEQAYDTSNQLRDVELTANIIEQAGPTMLKHGRLNILNHWIDALPYRLTSTRPGILSLQGAVAVSGKDIRGGLDKLTQAVSSFRGTENREQLARALVRRSIAHYSLSDYPSALQDADESMELVGEDQRFLAIKAQALKARGISLHCLDRSEEGIQSIESSLAIYQSLNDAPNIATDYQELGIAYRGLGKLDKANDAYQQALKYWRTEGNYYRLADLLNNYGVFRHYLGEFEQAVEALDEGLKYARLIGFARQEAFILSSLGDLYVDVQAFNDAETAYEDGLIIAQRIESRFLCFYLNRALSHLSLATGKLIDAHTLNCAASQYALPSSCLEQGLLALGSGQLAMAEQRLADGIAHFAVAVEQFQTGKLAIEEAQSHLFMAMALYKAGDESDARNHLCQAFDPSQNMKAHSLCMATAVVELMPVLEHFKLDFLVGHSVTKFLGQLRDLESKLPHVRRRLRKSVMEISPIKPKVVIQAFGRVHLTINDVEFTSPDWNSPTQREIIFYLLHHPEGANKSRLLDLFWGNNRSGPNQLANLLYKMRRSLGEELVKYRSERYYFNRDLDYEYDVERFLYYRDHAREETTPAVRAEFQLQMMQSYKGVFLPESDSLWVVPEQERLRRIFIDAALELGEYYLSQKEYSDCLDVCWNILEHEALCEEAYRLAMRTASAMGDRGNVNYYYQLYQRLTHKADDYAPSKETQALYRQLLG